MKRGCTCGLWLLGAIATSWIWIPALLLGLDFLLRLAERFLAGI